LTHPARSKHYGETVSIFLTIWVVMGLLSLPATILCFIFRTGGRYDPTRIGAILSATLLGTFLYSLPSVFACTSSHQNRSRIYWLNLFLGWTILGWLSALVWSLRASKSRKAVPIESSRHRYVYMRSPGRKNHRAGQGMLTAVFLLVVAGAASTIFFVKSHLLWTEDARSRSTYGPYGRNKMEANPGDVAVLAHAVGVIPGALVCSNMNTLQTLSHLYAMSWEETMASKFTHGQSTLIEGDPAPAPDPEDYGCKLFMMGTPMFLEHGNVVPVVRAQLPNGDVFRGVTMDQMAVAAR
jgi:hypothetical protein